jgi:hypothetical protein
MPIGAKTSNREAQPGSPPVTSLRMAVDCDRSSRDRKFDGSP